MKRILPALAVLAAVALALFFVLGKGDDKSDKKSSAPGTVRGPTDHRAAAGDSEGGSPPPRPLRMGSKAGDPSAALPAPAHKTYYREDGTEVRDHRANAPDPDLSGPVKPRQGIVTIRPTTLQEVRKSVNPSMNECLEPARPDAEEGARAQAVLTVSVHDEVLKVDELEVQSSGISDHEAFKSCMTDKLVGYSMSTPDEVEVESYKLTFPMRL